MTSLDDSDIAIRKSWAPLYIKRRVDQCILLQEAKTIDLFVRTEPQVWLDDGSGDEEESQSNDGGSKKGTLRKLFNKKKRQMQDRVETNVPLRLDNVIHDRFEQELRTLHGRLLFHSNNFATLTCTVAALMSKQEQADIAIFSPWLLADVTLTKHPQLKHIGLMDNRIFIEIGRAQLRSFILTDAADHGYTLEEADKKFTKVCANAEFWMVARFGKRKAQSSVAIAWNLDEVTHDPLIDFDRETRMRRLLSEVPLLMIGVLSEIELYQHMDVVIGELMKFDY